MAGHGGRGKQLRKILGIPGRGYRFVAPVELADAVGSSAAAAERAWYSPSTLPLPDKPSIAVLPFINMSGNSEQDYFADGMAEEILTALTRCSGLFVIARNSSFVYKKRSVDIRQIARELGVRYAVLQIEDFDQFAIEAPRPDMRTSSRRDSIARQLDRDATATRTRF
jgi:hypothetical protein